MDTMHLKDPLILFATEDLSHSPSFLPSFRIIMLSHCSSAITKDHFLVIFYGTECPLCAEVP